MTTTVMDHLSEGEVIRAVDEQLEMDEAGRVHEHLSTCAECSGVVQREHTRKQRLSHLLAATDYEVPPMSVPQLHAPVIDIASARARRTLWMQPRMRAAAAIALLLLGTLAIEPVRAAVTSWLRAQWERVTQPDRLSERPPAEPVQQAPAVGSRIEFSHERGELRLDFVSTAPGSSLHLEPTDISNVRADANAEGADFLVLPEGLRITGGSPNATYTVTLPPTITSVVVSSGGRITARMTRSEVAAGTTVQLKQ